MTADTVHRARLRLWQALITIMIVLLVMIGLQYMIAARKATQAQRAAQHALELSEQKWCSVIQIFTESYAANPPTTPAGRQFRVEFEKLAREFGC